MDHTVDTETSLLDVLQRLHPDASKRTLRRMLDVGRVSVDGTTERAARRVLRAGETVHVAGREGGTAKPPAQRLRVIFEDDRIFVVDKPAGLLTIATDRGESDTLYDRAWAHVAGRPKPRTPTRRAAERGRVRRPPRERVFIVHRLDRETSGVVVLAKDPDAKDALQQAFAKGDVDRRYVCLVEGVPEKEQDSVVSFLKQSKTFQVYETPDSKEGQRAETSYKVHRKGPGMALLHVTIGTGRRGQIRVQLAGIGHPVVGDKRHGAVTDPIRRVALHAERLQVPHPTTGEPVSFEAAVPAAFGRAMYNAATLAEDSDAT